MDLDEPRQHDHPARIDDFRITRVQILPDRDNDAVADQHIAAWIIADATVHAQDMAAMNQVGRHDRPALHACRDRTSSSMRVGATKTTGRHLPTTRDTG